MWQLSTNQRPVITCSGTPGRDGPSSRIVGSRMFPFQTWTFKDMQQTSATSCSYRVKLVGVKQWLWKLIVIFSSLISFTTSGGALNKFRIFYCLQDYFYWREQVALFSPREEYQGDSLVLKIVFDKKFSSEWCSTWESQSVRRDWSLLERTVSSSKLE